MNNEGTISRATSISRSSKAGSAVSRQQSLIKKNIAPHDLRPSDILIERFTAWKIIVKQLIAYFEGLADIENNVAREMTKLGAVIQVPFRSGNQFLGEGGLQDVYYQIRDRTRVIADQHANMGRTIDGSIVQHLQKLRVEIKAHIKNIQNDTGKLATAVAKERELSAKLIGDLGTNISVLKNTPMSVTHKTDPYVANRLVYKQLVKQVHTENALQKSLLLTQSSSALFEASLIQAIQSAWSTFEEWRSRMDGTIQDTWKILERSMASLAPDREWIAFAAREDHLVDPETPLRDPMNIQYPSKNDPSVLPVHIGLLERKKRYTRTYKEGYYVLTPAGFLHEYATSDPTQADKPIFSLFLPMCTLGPPSSPKVASHKFHIEGRKDGTGSTKTGGLRGFASTLTGKGGSGPAWTFRGRSHDDMMEWWNDIRMLCARYLVASEQLERSGPVAAAVRAVGYASEEEEDSEEEEGSSIEEEAEGEGEDEEYLPARELVEEEEGADHGYPPSYKHGSGTAVGTGNGADENGYAVATTNKQDPVQASPNVNGYEPAAAQAAQPEVEYGDSAADGLGANVSREPSLRQLEKAPEGRAPHTAVAREEESQAADSAEQSTEVHQEEEPTTADPGHAANDSRFTEQL